MALVTKDRVMETTTTTGTGALTLAGAVTGFQAFSAVCSVNDTCYYMIEAIDSNGAPTGDWEAGLGTYSAANTLTRTTVKASSNSGSAVSFAAGTKRVSISSIAASLFQPAGSVIRSSNIQSSSSSTFTVTLPTGAAAGDLMLVICGSGFGFGLNTTVGWSQLEHASQSNFLGDIFFKVLTTTDITNGSVTLTEGGTFNAVICAICFVGAPAIKNISTTKNATGSATRSVTISSGFNATDYAIYFGFNRNASANTINVGSAVQSINAASASGVVTGGVTGSTSVTATMSYGTISGTTGDYQGIIVLSG